MDSKNVKIFCLLFFFLPLLPLLPSLPPPYCDLETVLPFESHGWYGHALTIERLFKKYPISIVVEVGSWLGASTRHIASLVPPGGKVYAVDHWKGSEEHQLNAPYWHPTLPQLYEQFLSNVIHANLTHVIIPVRMTSLEGAKALSHLSVDLVYIDASHDTSSVLADLNAWYPLVKGHGILCGDDWNFPSVRQAVKIFAHHYNRLMIHIEDNFWFIDENK